MLFNLCSKENIIIKYTCFALERLCDNNIENINEVKKLNGNNVLKELCSAKNNKSYRKECKKAYKIITGSKYKCCCNIM